ncbi:hypothetical protein BASA60_005367 [Batrachochytrium salamandrivorans]|nr:hypothetical protein BASA60_005367 [Batrachochytrium salamandrivorans]
MGKANFPPGYGIAGHAAQIGKLVCVRDPLQSEMFHEDIDYRGGNDKARSLICIPICTEDGTPFGVLELVNKLGPNGKNEYFTHEDEYLLKVLGISAEAMMANANIYKNMLNAQKKLEVLLETTRSLGSILDIDVLVKMIMQSAKDLLSADRCTLFLNDNEQKQLLALIQGRDSLQGIRIPRNAGIAGAVFMSGHCYNSVNKCFPYPLLEPINIPDAYKDERFNPAVDKQTGYRTQNILCMPIKNIHGESIGVTQMINKKTGAFTIEDEKILSSFSAQVMTLGRYMSPALAKQDMQDNGQLGGKRKKVSILFSDIRSFTTISEGMEPTDVVEILNHHFTDAVNAITDEQGILDKFMVLSGNIGSTKRMEFSCIGDAVTSPLGQKDLQKFYGVTILVTEFSLQETGDAFWFANSSLL